MTHVQSAPPALAEKTVYMDALLPFFTQAVSDSTDLIATLDTEGRFTSVNRALLKVLGGSEVNLIGQYFGVALADSNSPALLREITERCLQGGSWKGECLFAKGDGTARPVALTIDPVRDDDGRIVGSVGIARDDAHGAAELRRSEQQFRQLVEYIH